MNPNFRCPSCDGPAIDVADGYDPFKQEGLTVEALAVSMRCANGHEWIHGRTYQDGRETGRGSSIVHGFSGRVVLADR